MTLWPAPKRTYATLPTPAPMRRVTDWPIPHPDVVRALAETPVSGLWLDHVPTGAEIAAQSVRHRRELGSRHSDVLETGDWAQYRYIWMRGHPEWMTPQQVMPDAWFDHRSARRTPPGLAYYTPQSGATVRTIVASGLSGSGYKHDAEGLPALWRRGLLRSAEERLLADHLLREAGVVWWYQIVLDEGWTIRQAAEVLREAGCYIGELCAWTNQWAKPPPDAPPLGSSPPESAREIDDRCHRQLSKTGAWPLERTIEIAANRDYQRVC